MRYLGFFLIFTITVFSCREKKQICLADQELIVVNKADYCFTGYGEVKLDKKNSNLICNLLSDLSPISEEVFVNMNSGYIEVFSNNQSVFSIIFSDTNGSVIRFNRSYYRNKKLISSIMKSLNMKPREDAHEDCSIFIP